MLIRIENRVDDYCDPIQTNLLKVWVFKSPKHILRVVQRSSIESRSTDALNGAL